MPESLRAAGRARPVAALALGVLLILSACVQSSSERTDSNSGETHFLRSCEDACPSGLSCICGVCTSACSEDRGCRAFAESAVCARPSEDRCDRAPETRACEVSCGADPDCRSLGAKHRCQGGVCRAPVASDQPRDAAPNDATAGTSDGAVSVQCGAKTCGKEQRCCDRCLGSCVAEAAELACPDELFPDRSCPDAGDAGASAGEAGTAGSLACGAKRCASGQRCCDSCTGLCVPESSEIACPDEGQPGRSCDDASAASCALASQSCLTSPCCNGLTCCEGTPIPAGEAYCGTTCPRSDYNVKTDFAAIDADLVLSRVLALPISSWRYRDEPVGVSHIGPMAQDFKEKFGVGGDDKHIFPLDEGGISLAAIQALHRQLAGLAREQRALRAENARLTRDLDALLKRAERALSCDPR